MALTTENVKQISVIAMTEGMGIVSDNWRSVYEFREDDVPSLRLAALTGVGEIPTWDGASDYDTAEMDSTGGQVLTYVGRGLQVRIGKFDERDVPGVVEAAMRRVGRGIASTYKTLACNVLAGSFDTTKVVPGQKPLCDTDHPLADGTTRSNKITSALDRTAFMAAVAKFRRWKDYQGIELDLADQGFYLVVPPELEETAHEVIHSAVSGDDYQSNAAALFNTDILVMPGLSDTTDWFVVSKALAPLVFWERMQPSLIVNRDQDNGALKINVDFAIAAAAQAHPDGIVGSSVS